MASAGAPPSKVLYSPRSKRTGQSRTRLINEGEHRGRRGARVARRDDREYREYLSEEQRRQSGCITGRMPAPFMRWVLVSRVRQGSRWLQSTLDVEAPT